MNYSKKAIIDAFIILLQNHPYDEITVSEVVEKAMISRATYYNHFNQLEDVLKEAYTQAYSDCFSDKAKEHEYLKSHEFINDIVTFFDENTNLVKALLKWNILGNIAFKQTKDSIDYAQSYKKEVTFDHEDYYVLYLWSSCFNVLTLWCLKGKPETREEMIKLLKIFNNM